MTRYRIENITFGDFPGDFEADGEKAAIGAVLAGTGCDAVIRSGWTLIAGRTKPPSAKAFSSDGDCLSRHE